jgi:hypothetical protein
MIYALIFLIMWCFGIVNTQYDWLIFGLLIIADEISGLSGKIVEKLS